MRRNARPDTCSQSSRLPKRRYAKDVGHVPGVPALGEHPHRDHAADVFAGLPLPAGGHEDLPNGVLFSAFVPASGAWERRLFLDGFPQFARDRIAGLEETRVDQHRGRLWLRSPVGARSSRAAAGCRAFRPLPRGRTGDPPVERVGVSDLVGDNDEDRQNTLALEGRSHPIRVVPVKLLERLPDSRLGLALLDLLLLREQVDVAVAGSWDSMSSATGDARDFDQPGFDGVEQREIRDGPREDLGIELDRSPEPHRGGGEVEHALEPAGAVEGGERGGTTAPPTSDRGARRLRDPAAARAETRSSDAPRH